MAIYAENVSFANCKHLVTMVTFYAVHRLSLETQARHWPKSVPFSHDSNSTHIPTADKQPGVSLSW